MIWWANFISNAIVLVVCVWAVLNTHVQTKIIGTIALSCLGLFSAMNIVKPGFAGFFSTESQTFANISLACLALWFYLRYHDYLIMHPEA
jgi:hypothetical protein